MRNKDKLITYIDNHFGFRYNNFYGHYFINKDNMKRISVEELKSILRFRLGYGYTKLGVAVNTWLDHKKPIKDEK